MWRFLCPLLLVACVSLPERRAALLAEYQAVAAEAPNDPDKARAAFSVAYDHEFSDVELREEVAVDEEKAKASAAIEVAYARRRHAAVRAAFEAGDFSQALEDRLLGVVGRKNYEDRDLFNEPNTMGGRESWAAATRADNTLWSQREELLTQIRRKRGERECPAKLAPLLASKDSVSMARDLVFDAQRATVHKVRLVCSPEWTLKVAEASFAAKLYWCQGAVDELLHLVPQLEPGEAEDAFIGSALGRVVSLCVEKGTPSDLNAARDAFKKTLRWADRTKGRAALLSNAEAALTADGKQVLVALEGAGKYSEARSLAQSLGDTATVERLDRDHPAPPGVRLARRAQQLKNDMMVATALLQWLARQHGTSADAMDFKTEADILGAFKAGGFQTQRMPTFKLAPGCGCEEDLKKLLGDALRPLPDSWTVRKASCSSRRAPESTSHTSTHYETRSTTREVPTGDGITTRTVHGKESVAVTKTESRPGRDDAPYRMTMTFVTRLPGFPELELEASGQGSEPNWADMRMSLRGGLLLKAAAQSKSLGFIDPEVTKGPRAKLAKATTENEKEGAYAELVMLTQGQDAEALGYFVRKYGLSEGGPWPWSR